MICAKRRRKGASSVEFALTFPLVLFFFTGLIAFTQAILLRDTAQHAAYEGARKGLTIDATNASVVSDVKDFLKTMRVANPVIEVTPANLNTTSEQVSVTVRIPFQDNAWIAAAFIPDNWTMGAEVTLTKFRKTESN